MEKRKSIPQRIPRWQFVLLCCAGSAAGWLAFLARHSFDDPLSITWLERSTIVMLLVLLPGIAALVGSIQWGEERQSWSGWLLLIALFCATAVVFSHNYRFTDSARSVTNDFLFFSVQTYPENLLQNLLPVILPAAVLLAKNWLKHIPKFSLPAVLLLWLFLGLRETKLRENGLLYLLNDFRFEMNFWLQVAVLPGMITALTQMLLVERFLGKSMRGWLPVSLVGWLSAVAAAYAWEVGYPVSLVVLSLAVFMPPALTQMGWLWLRVRRAWLWGIAGIINSLIFLIPCMMRLNGRFPGDFLLAAGLVQAFVSGWILYSLWTQQHEKSKNTLPA